MQIHQGLVNLQAVFHERNLQFFRVQAAAKSFECFARLTIGSQSCRAVTPAMGKLPPKKVRLISEHWGLQALDPGDGSLRLRFRDGQFSDLKRDAREEKVCEHGFSGEQGLVEKSGCARTEPARLKVAP